MVQSERPMVRLAGVASVQHGLVTRSQSFEAGVARGAIQHLLGTGQLEVAHPGVYRVPGSPRTWWQSVLAAVLAAGGEAVASHRTAAALWGLRLSDEVEITVRRSRLPRLEGVTVHRSRDLHRDRPARQNLIPVTTPMRAVLDLGSVVPTSEVSDALETGLAARLFTLDGVLRHRAAVARPGRRGSGVLREVLEERMLGHEAPDSILEPRMAMILGEAGLPNPMFQFEVRINGVLIARVDFAYPDLRIAIEVDGWKYHSSPEAMTRHLRRQNKLVLNGWTVLRFTWVDVVRRPEHVASEIRRALGASGHAVGA